MPLSVWKSLPALALGLLLSACSGLLPHGEAKTSSPWSDYAAVKRAYDQVIAGQSTESDLKRLGFTPERTPNVHILNHLEILNRVTPSQAISREDLPKALLTCLRYQDGCHAYEINLLVTENERYGNFFADFLNFRRKTHIRGWSFNAVFVVQKDLVVYKVWNGTPQIDEHQRTNNPLGPLQGIGPESVKPSVSY